MGAIFRRELSAYFTSPVAYVFLAAYYFFAGFFFVTYNIYGSSGDMAGCLQMLFFVSILLIPLLTMRLFSEDIRQKTDQALLTSPVSLPGIVFGKFFAAMVLFAAAVAICLVLAVIMAFMGASIPWASTIGTIIGLYLLGGVFISVGLLASSLTESVVVAAVTGFVMMLAFYLIDTLSSVIPIEIVSKALSRLSLNEKYNEFSMGLFNFSSVLFFVSAIVVFNFLTIRVLEKRRWS